MWFFISWKKSQTKWIECFLFPTYAVDEKDNNDDDIRLVYEDPEQMSQAYSPDASPTQTHHQLQNFRGATRPRLKLPISPSKMKASYSHDDLESLVYDEPTLDQNLDDNYHVLADHGNGTYSLERSSSPSGQQEWYDDMGVSDSVVYTMNKNPPPVWRPDDKEPPPLPPNKRPVRSHSPPIGRQKPAVVRPVHFSPDRNIPLPLPKLPDSADGDTMRVVGKGIGRGMGNIKDDPKFKRKLQEKRQEIYGDAGSRSGLGHGRSLSLGEGEGWIQEDYEAVMFTVADPVDYEVSSCKETTPDPPTTSRQSFPSENQNPPCIHNRSHDSNLNRLTSTSLEHVAGSIPPPLPSREVICTPPPLPSREVICTPPPLPSREVIRPPRSYIKTPSSKSFPDTPDYEFEETPPPPVPTRVTSDRSKPAPSVSPKRQRPPVVPPQNPRRNSLPSPSHTMMASLSPPRRDQPLPLPPTHLSPRREQEACRNLAQVLSSSPSRLRRDRDESPVPLPPPKTWKAHPSPKPVPPTDMSADVQEHNFNMEVKDDNDDIFSTVQHRFNPQTQKMDCEILDKQVISKEHPPPIKVESHSEHLPLPTNRQVPPPVKQRNPPPSTNHRIVVPPATSTRGSPPVKERAPTQVTPPINPRTSTQVAPPINPRISSEHSTNHPPVQPRHNGHSLNHPVAPPTSTNNERPRLKPPTTKKPDLSNKPPVAVRRQPPPTAPKPSKMNEQEHDASNKEPHPPLPAKYKPKPMVPKKPVLPLC